MFCVMYKILKKSFQIYKVFKGFPAGYTGRTFTCETFFKFRRAEKSFICEGSSRVSRRRIFKGFVHLKTSFSDFVHLAKHFWGSVKHLLFLRVFNIRNRIVIHINIHLFNKILIIINSNLDPSSTFSINLTRNSSLFHIVIKHLLNY